MEFLKDSPLVFSSYTPLFAVLLNLIQQQTITSIYADYNQLLTSFSLTDSVISREPV